MHKEEAWLNGILVEAINKQKIVSFKRRNLSFVLFCKQHKVKGGK